MAGEQRSRPEPPRRCGGSSLESRHPLSSRSCLGGGRSESQLPPVRGPAGPAVSPDSGTARWGPGSHRACKSADNGGRGREPRGAGRFLGFSGNWAGQDGKVLELACKA
ncbi:unnamed protein product [Rangifer tarandus platyrhynchus]|uniref:Uncharacterized protein n=1 Tax=Rangifer tarandus platyrhynchus TaxID=3082113 RepID=A0AC59Z6M4_RANTA